MENHELLDILGRAFSYGEIDALECLLDENCNYSSDYGQREITSAVEILDIMHDVYAAVQENIAKGKDCSYTYKVIPIESILKNGITLDDLCSGAPYNACKEGLLLYQFGAADPVAVVLIKLNPIGQITEINLSRSRRCFDITFYSDGELEDSDRDTPFTVIPRSFHDRQAGMKVFRPDELHEYVHLDNSEVYIWRKANQFTEAWLKEEGYYTIESQIFDDCIGYRCYQDGRTYTVYMYAYGQRRTAQMDGVYCAKLLDYQFSKDSTVLVICLNVKRFKDGDEIKYSVCNFAGRENGSIETWKVTKIDEKNILEFYPGNKMMNLTYRLMYAFNRDNRDVYDCIVCSQNPSFKGLDTPGVFMNKAFYINMFRLHKEHGDMKIGYVRFNDAIYSQVPYIDGYGFITFHVDISSGKIEEITVVPFDSEEYRVSEFIRTEERENDSMYAGIASLKSIEPLKPVFSERFALKLTFDNGEYRKYILPIGKKCETEEVVSYDDHVFTDKIWSSAEIGRNSEEYRGMAVQFKNGYSISILKCCDESIPYVEPELCSDIVYENNDFEVERYCKWNADSIYADEETGLLKVLISEGSTSYYGTSTYASMDGKLRCSMDFDSIDSFHEGLARVKKQGYGYGFIDKNMRLVIPMIYEEADIFQSGKAKVKKDGRWLFVGRDGKEYRFQSTPFDPEYVNIGRFHEGMCKVSTFRPVERMLKCHSRYSEMAGIWGFINDAGDEIVTPQYIYAEDFSGGVAVVCKGKWITDEEKSHSSGFTRYKPECELWGAIDKNGNEIVPFIFDAIKHFDSTDSVLIAHYGGWDNGYWGIIDKHGNWLVEPIFDDVACGYHDGLFAFYKEVAEWETNPMGIYDMKQHRVILEPQFFNVEFLDDGWIQVDVFDVELGKTVEKLIDCNGNEKFHSVYTSLCTFDNPYNVTIKDEVGERHGLIDENGNIVFPCEYGIPWDGFSYEQRIAVYCDGDNFGIKDFDGNVIVEPRYHEIYEIDHPLIIVITDDNGDYKSGMITRTGEEVIPAEYQRICWFDDTSFLCCKDGLCEMYRLIPKI